MAEKSEQVETSFDYDQAVTVISTKIVKKPEILIICGSGQGDVFSDVSSALTIPYKDIPGLPECTAEGHKSSFLFATISEKFVMVMQGRFHYYEGYSLKEVAIPVRLAHRLGATHLIVTNSAGVINPDFKVGNVMIIKDHVNLFAFGGHHPLRGPNDDAFGPRFYSMNRAYDKRLRLEARKISKELDIEDDVHEGVYAMHCGPSYGTVAEERIMQMLGADAVGMSTVPEVLVARHCGMTVFGLSFLSDRCVLSYDDEHDTKHEEVLAMAEKQKLLIGLFLRRIIKVVNVE